MPDTSPKQVVQRFLEIVRAGVAPERAHEFFAPTVTAHQMTAERETAIARTPENYAEHVREMLEEYGNFTLEITELLADGPRVYARWRQVGHHLREIDGFAPTKRPVVEIASAVYRVDEGKIAEYWIQVDRAGLRAQLEAR